MTGDYREFIKIIFEIGYHKVVQDGLELLIFLPQSPKS